MDYAPHRVEIKAGRDPHDPTNRPKKINTEIRKVSELLDAYWWSHTTIPFTVAWNHS